jgi:hypothetical protein
LINKQLAVNCRGVSLKSWYDDATGAGSHRRSAHTA